MMLDLNDVKPYKSILCLHGELPEADFFHNMNLPVIAADGAANRLHELGISSKLIVGDMDSVHPSLLEQYPFLHFPSQDSSDYQKAMSYLQDEGLLPAIITGSSGGFLDHILNNLNIFMETGCLLYSPPVNGLVLKGGTGKQWSFPVDTKISIMGIPEAIVSSRGLKWELNRTHLAFPGRSSCFNRTKFQDIVLDIHEGSALVFIYEDMIKDAGI